MQPNPLKELHTKAINGSIHSALKLVNHYGITENLVEMMRYYVIILNILYERAIKAKTDDRKLKYFHCWNFYSNAINDFLMKPHVKSYRYYMDILIIASEYLNSENSTALSNLHIIDKNMMFAS